MSAIDAKKNQLALEQAKRVLAQLEQDIQSHTASGQAAIYLAREKWNKAKLSMDQAQENIKKMKVPAAMDGLVSIEKNRDANGGFFFDGMSLPDYREGDQVTAGSGVAEVIDAREMELVSKVNEHDRSNVRVGQSVRVEFDASPGQLFAILGDERKNILYLPRQALFLKDGKRVVYVKSGNGFEQRDVTIQSESESRAAVEGLTAGAEIALVDPTAPRRSGISGGSSPGIGGVTP